MRLFFMSLILFIIEAGAKPPSPHHIVDVEIPASMRLPKAFVPKQNKLACTTCHGIENIADQPLEAIDKTAKDFLIGGPYPQLESFCFRCHDPKPYQRRNIHIQRDATGNIIDRSCLYCHTEVLSRQKPPKDPKLRLPAEKICWGCHLRTPHLNALSHQVKPSRKVQTQLEKTRARHKVYLPLGQDGHIICTSCHTPHAAGVLPNDWPEGKQTADTDPQTGMQHATSRWQTVFSADKQKRLEALPFTSELRYQRLTAETLMRLPAKNGELCQACHAFDD